MWQTITQTLSEINIWSILVRFLLSIIIGGSLGIERKLKNRAAGFRTYILVCLGSCLASLTGLFVTANFDGGDPARIAAQVISGIGFLGAGSIIITKERRIEGLTTASGLWAAAAIGVALGMGFYGGALIAGVLAFLTFTFLEKVEDYILSKKSDETLYVELTSIDALPAFIDYLAKEGLEPVETGIHKAKDPASKTVGIDIQLLMHKEKSTNEIIRELSKWESVSFISLNVE